MASSDFNFQEFRILNCDNREMVPRVAAQFMYRGFEISMSTAFMPYPTKVAVFRNDAFEYECETVEQAILWVNDQAGAPDES